MYDAQYGSCATDGYLSVVFIGSSLYKVCLVIVRTYGEYNLTSFIEWSTVEVGPIHFCFIYCLFSDGVRSSDVAQKGRIIND